MCIIDDDEDFVSFLVRYLAARHCAVTAFASAEAFLADGSAADAEFFLVDLTLPGADGVDVVGLIRARSKAGVIVISGRMGPDAFSSALAAGADMFINKPVRFDQVYQAILSVSRRIGPSRNTASGWTYHAAANLLVAPSGHKAHLTPTEQKLLGALLAANGLPVSRDRLAEAAGLAPSRDDRNLDAAMFRMRRRIEQQTSEPAPLRTIHGSGYAAAGITECVGQDG